MEGKNTNTSIDVVLRSVLKIPFWRQVLVLFTGINALVMSFPFNANKNHRIKYVLPSSSCTMNSSRFGQLLLLVAFSVSDTDALASPRVPPVGVSASEQTSLYEYTHGESCLFGGSASYSATNLWTGKKGPAQHQSENQKNVPSFSTSFVPDNVNGGSSFTPRQQ
jgi:hypothetical protein